MYNFVLFCYATKYNSYIKYVSLLPTMHQKQWVTANERPSGKSSQDSRDHHF